MKAADLVSVRDPQRQFAEMVSQFRLVNLVHRQAMIETVTVWMMIAMVESMKTLCLNKQSVALVHVPPLVSRFVRMVLFGIPVKQMNLRSWVTFAMVETMTVMVGPMKTMSMRQ